MDKYRQQNSRYQRGNCKSCYQQQNYCDKGCYMNNYNDCSNCNSECNQCKMEDCPGAGRDELRGMPLAMAYVPWQQFENLYEECEALYHGTIFCDLDLDFCGMRCE